MIQGRIVHLRPATFDDRRRIYEWLAESDITHKMLGAPYFPDNEVPDWDYFVQDYNPHFFTDDDPEQGRSYIILAGDEEVGHINYNEIERTSKSVELDIWLAAQRYTGKGYGSDAINTLCEYLYQELGCTTFILAPSARNHDAVQAYRKCGFDLSTEPPPLGFIPDYNDTVVMIRRMGRSEGSA